MRVKWLNTTGDGRWENPENWSTGCVPTAKDDVVVYPGYGQLRITTEAECHNYTQYGGSYSGGGLIASADVLVVRSAGHITVSGDATLSYHEPWYRRLYKRVRRWFKWPK